METTFIALLVICAVLVAYTVLNKCCEGLGALAYWMFPIEEEEYDEEIDES